MNYLGENSARELIRLTKNEIANNSGGGGTIDIDLEGANEGEANLVDSDTLGGKTENELSVLNSEKLSNFTLAELMLQFYRVGTVYISNDPTDPSTYFGGTWRRIKDMFILAAGDTYEADTTGGEAAHNHKYGLQYGGYYRSISLENNTNAGLLDYDEDGNSTIISGTNSGSFTSTVNNAAATTTKEASMTHQVCEANTTTGNNMPPYITRYVWERIA